MIITCPECGEKTTLKTKICSHCGVKLKQCPKCGNVLKESATVCDYCGMESEAMQKSILAEKKKLLDKQTEQYCTDYHKLTKPFVLLAWFIGMVGCIPYFCITVYKLFSWTSFHDLGEELQSIRSFFILSIFALAIAAFFATSKDVFACHILYKKMDKDKFDAQSYYKNFIQPIEIETNRAERAKLILSSLETIKFLPLCLGKTTPRVRKWDTLRAFMTWIPVSLYLIAVSTILYNMAQMGSEHLSLYGNLDNLTLIKVLLPSIIILVATFIAHIIINKLFPFGYKKWIKKYLTTK